MWVEYYMISKNINGGATKADGRASGSQWSYTTAIIIDIWPEFQFINIMTKVQGPQNYQKLSMSDYPSVWIS